MVFDCVCSIFITFEAHIPDAPIGYEFGICNFCLLREMPLEFFSGKVRRQAVNENPRHQSVRGELRLGLYNLIGILFQMCTDKCGLVTTYVGTELDPLA